MSQVICHVCDLRHWHAQWQHLVCLATEALISVVKTAVVWIASIEMCNRLVSAMDCICFLKLSWFVSFSLFSKSQRNSWKFIEINNLRNSKIQSEKIIFFLLEWQLGSLSEHNNFSWWPAYVMSWAPSAFSLKTPNMRAYFTTHMIVTLKLIEMLSQGKVDNPGVTLHMTGYAPAYKKHRKGYFFFDIRPRWHLLQKGYIFRC